MVAITIHHVKSGLMGIAAVGYGEWVIMLCGYLIMILAIFSK